MTSGGDGAALIDALTDEDLARLAGRLRIWEQDTYPMRDVDGNAISPLAATTGRVQVSPGQTIQSQWGNTVWDQSVNTFTTTADRDTQWPTPKEGAVCYTQADNRLWYRRSNGWIPMNVDAAIDYTSGGVPIFGSYNNLRPVKVMSRRFTATGDANGFYTTTMPANVTSILSILAMSETMATGTALILMIRSDVTNAAQVVIQARRGDTGAAIATVAATIHIRIEYQTP